MTDPARTTKEERDRVREYMRTTMPQSDGLSGELTVCDVSFIGLLDDADAADALRAQLAEAQEHAKGWMAWASEYESKMSRAQSERDQYKAELAAAQAKLAVPVPEDVQKLVAMTSKRTTTNAPHPNYPGHRIIGWVVPTDELDGLGRPAGYPREITHALEALARDNAALRTKAEALERERDGLKAALVELLDDVHDLTAFDYELEGYQMAQAALAEKL